MRAWEPKPVLCLHAGVIAVHTIDSTPHNKLWNLLPVELWLISVTDRHVYVKECEFMRLIDVDRSFNTLEEISAVTGRVELESYFVTLVSRLLLAFRECMIYENEPQQFGETGRKIGVSVAFTASMLSSPKKKFRVASEKPKIIMLGTRGPKLVV